MRPVAAGLLAAFFLMPVMGHAQSYDCDRSAKIVKEAVEARKAGAAKSKTLSVLQDQLDAESGAMLAEFIYALPEAQLTEAVSEAWRAQCAQL